MSDMTPRAFVGAFDDAAAVFDRVRLRSAAGALVDHLRSRPRPFPVAPASRILDCRARRAA